MKKFLNKNIRRLRYLLALVKANSSFTTDSKSINETSKYVVFDLQSKNYHRYLYTLIVFYKRSGYSVYVKTDLQGLARLSMDKYAKNLLHDDSVFFIKELPDFDSEKFNLIKLNTNYFQKDELGSYHIPMCQHPTMYDLEIDHLQHEYKRINSIAFAGDFRDDLYSNTTLQHYFEHLNRRDMLQSIRSQTNNFQYLEDTEDQALEAHKIYIADNEVVRYTPLEYRHFISKFDFFLGLPGIHMPLCHNIVEAMSVGTIPFLHQSYADLMHPKLVHLKTAFIFNDFDQLQSAADEAFALENEVKGDMKQEVLAYYHKFLSSESVVQNMEEYSGIEYKLIAEWNSI